MAYSGVRASCRPSPPSSATLTYSLLTRPPGLKASLPVPLGSPRLPKTRQLLHSRRTPTATPLHVPCQNCCADVPSWALSATLLCPAAVKASSTSCHVCTWLPAPRLFGGLQLRQHCACACERDHEWAWMCCHDDDWLLRCPAGRCASARPCSQGQPTPWLFGSMTRCQHSASVFACGVCGCSFWGSTPWSPPKLLNWHFDARLASTWLLWVRGGGGVHGC
jgi:hypothetical protein